MVELPIRRQMRFGKRANITRYIDYSHLVFQLDCDPQFWEIAESRNQLGAERRVFAQDPFDTMRFSVLQGIKMSNPRCNQLSDRHHPDLVDLFHLVRRIVPGTAGEASGQLHCISQRNRILVMHPTVNDTANQPTNMQEDQIFILLECREMFLKLFRGEIVRSTEFGLDEKRDFVGLQGEIPFDWKPDSLSSIYFFIERFFAGFEPDLVEFDRLSDGGKLYDINRNRDVENQRVVQRGLTISESLARSGRAKNSFIVSNLM
jgi:hypothetical protein